MIVEKNTNVSWLKDKWNWLKTFNKKPKVIINAEYVSIKDGHAFITSNDRVDIEGEIKTINMIKE